MSNPLKKRLIKRGSIRPDLRPYIRPVLAEMGKRSVKDVQDTLRGELSKRLNEIFNILQSEKKRTFGEFKKMGFDVNERSSYIDYQLHGSDGLRIGGVIKFEDPQGRSKEEVDRLIEENGIFENSWVQREGVGWYFGFGDDV